MKKHKDVKKILIEGFFLGLSVCFVSSLVGILVVLGADTTQMSQSISGTLDVQIVDSSGNSVASPNIVFPAKAFSMTSQTSQSVLGSSDERMRITNPSGSTDTWTLSMAATNGTTSAWSNGSNTYDFNDSSLDATDGLDADLVGGQMTIDPSVATITGVSGTATSNVSKGNSDSFVEGTVDSIDLMSATSGAAKPGQWDLVGVGISQSIPSAQAVGSYVMEMTLTVI